MSFHYLLEEWECKKFDTDEALASKLRSVMSEEGARCSSRPLWSESLLDSAPVDATMRFLRLLSMGSMTARARKQNKEKPAR